MRAHSYFLLPVLTLALAASAQTSPSPQPAPSTPCSTGQVTAKPTLKVPSSLQKAWDKYSPVSSADLNKANAAKPLPPCPLPSAPNTPPAPAMKMPVGVVTTWLCNPIVTSTDSRHTASLVMPDELSPAEPPSASTFEADGAKADLKAATSCANLRRDAKDNKVFLTQ